MWDSTSDKLRRNFIILKAFINKEEWWKSIIECLKNSKKRN